MSTELVERTTVKDMVGHVQRIQDVCEAVMKKDIHYGVIPGTKKPALYKPGAEKLLQAFQMAALPDQVTIMDLGIPGEEVRYRVVAPIVHWPSGNVVGHGVGECSSQEDKYAWRAVVCQEEFDEADPSERRGKWKKGEKGKVYQVNQIRTHPADVANTILKMAKKRSLIDGTLTVTAASDMFDQDLEDLPEGLVDTAQPKEKQPTQTRKPSGPVMPPYFGKYAGKSISDPEVPIAALEECLAGKQKQLEKGYPPERERFRSNDEALAAALMEEIGNRSGSTVPQETDAESAEALEIIKQAVGILCKSPEGAKLLKQLNKKFDVPNYKKLTTEKYSLYLDGLQSAQEELTKHGQA